MAEIDRYRFVPKYYQMDPDREDLLFDGTELREGMVVLIEDSGFRADVREDRILNSDGSVNQRNGDLFEKAMRYNRWVMVTRLGKISEDRQIGFIAVYEDGSKKKISVPVGYAWYVRLPIDERPAVTSYFNPPPRHDVNDPEVYEQANILQGPPLEDGYRNDADQYHDHVLRPGQ